MTKRFSFLLTWILLLAFGIPSIGGRGLHLFLEQGAGDHPAAACGTVFVAPGADSDRCQNGQDGPFSYGPGHCGSNSQHGPEAEEVLPLWEPAHHGHDAEHSFLCQFLVQPQSGITAAVSPASLLLPEEAEFRVPLPVSRSASFHSGRSPPFSLV